MASVMPSLKNITWERLEREGAVTYPCDAPDKPGNEIIFTQSFPTKSGRAKIVPAALLAPHELPDDEYPMVLTTGRLLEHWHTGSMTRRASTLDALEPEAIAGLNPRDMEKMGIQGLSYRKYDLSLCTYCTPVNGVTLWSIAMAWKGKAWDDVEVLTGKTMKPTPGKKKTILD